MENVFYYSIVQFYLIVCIPRCVNKLLRSISNHKNVERKFRRSTTHFEVEFHSSKAKALMQVAYIVTVKKSCDFIPKTASTFDVCRGNANF